MQHARRQRHQGGVVKKGPKQVLFNGAHGGLGQLDGPGQGRYREITSTSNTTDYQARRLKVRYRSADGNKLVHTLNGTAVAVGRFLIAIVENHQRPDGTIAVPEALRSYVGFDTIG